LQHPLHLDINSDDPIEVTINASSIDPDGWGTSASLFLTTVPPNLDIIYRTRIARLDFDGKRAIGVSIGNGTVGR
jgi:hypothetical protein